MFTMNYRAWNVLCWNTRGLNDRDKWHSIRNKIEESCANIFCLQETKRENIDLQFIHNFAPNRFDSFDYSPSAGASGGILSAGPPIISQVALLKSTLLP
jgi:exonuclease III